MDKKARIARGLGSFEGVHPPFIDLTSSADRSTSRGASGRGEVTVAGPKKRPQRGGALRPS
jgi:hypothetical protein